MKFNNLFINCLSITLSIIIVAFLSIGISKAKNNIFSDETQGKIEVKEEKFVQKEIENNVTKEESTKYENIIVNDNVEEIYTEEENEFDWYIEIPKIKLYAPIEEGTDDEVLNRSVGHFENTSRRNGNCGLAAHNRGYRVNYFAKVKELEKGDTIFYFVDGKKYEYKVSEITIIYETDWSKLEETNDNKITLITCVENRDEYRLCVQGVLVE